MLVDVVLKKTQAEKQLQKMICNDYKNAEFQVTKKEGEKTAEIKEINQAGRQSRTLTRGS